jgi:hypothetical protein
VLAPSLVTRALSLFALQVSLVALAPGLFVLPHGVWQAKMEFARVGWSDFWQEGSVVFVARWK